MVDVLEAMARVFHIQDEDPFLLYHLKNSALLSVVIGGCQPQSWYYISMDTVIGSVRQMTRLN